MASEHLMNILSKYLAPWAIPNENIPLHIIWDPKENIQEITLFKPEWIKIKEVFNSSYNVEDDFKVRFKNFDSNGYFSIELISKEIEALEKDCNIILEFKKEDTIEKISLFTKILRPKLESIVIPDEIKVSEIGGELIVNNPIKIRYQGHGRVYVHVQSSEESDLQIKIPMAMQEVLDKFQTDLNLGLDELKPKYSQYEKFFNFLKEGDNLSLNDIESKLEAHSEIFENDINFFKEFLEKFAWAVARNYALLDDYIITPFIEYVRSAPIRTVWLINPIFRIDFFKDAKLLNMQIEYFDSKENKYEPIKISTMLVGDTDGEIDLYKLFSWE